LSIPPPHMAGDDGYDPPFPGSKPGVITNIRIPNKNRSHTFIAWLHEHVLRLCSDGSQVRINDTENACLSKLSTDRFQTASWLILHNRNYNVPLKGLRSGLPKTHPTSMI